MNELLKNQHREQQKGRKWHIGPIVKLFKHPQYDFFLSSTTLIRKGKRKLRSHGTEARKQERKLNHTDSEKAENVSKRSLLFSPTFCGYAKKKTNPTTQYAYRTVFLNTLCLIKTQGIPNERDTTKEKMKLC